MAFLALWVQSFVLEVYFLYELKNRKKNVWENLSVPIVSVIHSSFSVLNEFIGKKFWVQFWNSITFHNHHFGAVQNIDILNILIAQSTIEIWRLWKIAYVTRQFFLIRLLQQQPLALGICNRIFSNIGHIICKTNNPEYFCDWSSDQKPFPYPNMAVLWSLCYSSYLLALELVIKGIQHKCELMDKPLSLLFAWYF